MNGRTEQAGQGVGEALGEQVAQWGGKRREILLTATKESEK